MPMQATQPLAFREATRRSVAPVFVLGCPRSGTTLLYDMLLSSGGFAVYLAESNVFNVLATRFGDLRSRQRRERLLRVWKQTKLFRATGLEHPSIEARILDDCRDSGDFLRIVMQEIARQQGMYRWAENSPESILHLPDIKRLLPDALVIHIIRDGRDVALSLERLRYVRPFPWQQRQSLFAAGAYWEWIVQKGRAFGESLGNDYIEVHFEDLLTSPQKTLDRIGAFIEHELEYERIQRVAYGSVNRPNTSFSTEHSSGTFTPVGRWKRGIKSEHLTRLETMIGQTLIQTGYPLSGKSTGTLHTSAHATKQVYRAYFESKLWFKLNPIVRAIRPALSAAEIDATVLAEDHAPDIRPLVAESAMSHKGWRRE